MTAAEGGTGSSTAGPRDRGRRGAVLTIVPATVVLAGLSPAFMVDWSSDTAPLINVGMALGLVLWSSYRLVGCMVSSTPDLVRGFFYVFVYIFLGMATLAQTVSGTFPLDGRSYDPDVVTAGLFVFVVGVAAYECGWVLGRRRAPDEPRRPLRLTFGFSPPRAVALGLLGLAVCAYQVAGAGVGAFFTSRQQTSAVLFGREGLASNYMSTDKAAGIFATFLAQYPVFIALFVILYCRRHGLWSRPGTLAADASWRALIAALVVANVIMNNPMGNGRMWFCIVLVAFASIYLPYHRPRAVRLYLAGALVVLLFFFTSMDAFRRTDAAGPAASSQTSRLVSDGTYGAFQMQLNGENYVRLRGHTDGLQMFGAAATLIPRKFWTSKPGPTGQLIDDRYLRSSSLWTESTVDFGLLGVVGVFLLYGAASARAHRLAARVPPGAVAAVVPIFAVFQVFLLRGSLQPAFGTLYSLLLALAAVLVVRRSPLRRTHVRSEYAGVRTPAVTGGA